jgi:hypothetical protein
MHHQLEEEYLHTLVADELAAPSVCDGYSLSS